MSIQRTIIKEMTCNGRTGCTNSMIGRNVSNGELRRDTEKYSCHSNPKGDYDLCPGCSYKFLKN